MKKPSLETMYHLSGDISDLWMEKLFPKEAQGCINFGYWKGISYPLTKEKRILAQKQLYFLLFQQIPNASSHILEVGCGRGHGVFWLQKLGFSAYGIDCLKTQIETCIHAYPNYASRFSQGTAENLPFPNQSFDAVYALESSQHFSSFHQFCLEAHRTLRSHGILILSTYFILNQEKLSLLKKLIPDTLEGTHNALVLDNALTLCKSAGFNVSSLTFLGENIFPFYANWHHHQLKSTPLEALTPERKRWIPYYTGGTKGHKHPWEQAFREQILEYPMIVLQKP
ncbi:MAG: class I SAM-dependent methyltransferase [Chlamydiota bacterium]